MSDSEDLPFEEEDIDEDEQAEEDKRVVDLHDGLPPLPYDGTRSIFFFFLVDKKIFGGSWNVWGLGVG